MTEQGDVQEPILTRDFEASTVEEAIALALADLNIPRENLKIQILTEGKRGLFGMQGAKNAKIWVVVLNKPNEE